MSSRIIPRSWTVGTRRAPALLVLICCIAFVVVMIDEPARKHDHNHNSHSRREVDDEQSNEGRPHDRLAEDPIVNDLAADPKEEPQAHEKGIENQDGEEEKQNPVGNHEPDDIEPVEQNQPHKDHHDGVEPQRATDPPPNDMAEAKQPKQQTPEFESRCNIFDESLPADEVKHIRSAVGRATSANCKQNIIDTWCSDRANNFYPELTTRKLNDYTCAHTGVNPPGFTSSLNTPPRIAFMFVVFQAGLFNQIKRLFHAMYSERHWYLFHVEARSQMLVPLIKAMVKDYPNAWVAPFRYETLWGSSQLFQTYLAGIKELLSVNWDFFINLSECDYPLKPLKNIEAELTSVKGRNFMGSRQAFDESKFRKKQALEFTFYQCDDHMFNLGPRHPPSGDVFHFRGGSDWYIFARDFSEFVVNEPNLFPLKQFYNYTLLSGESFFHTVAQSTGWCKNVTWANKRLENWQGRIGCTCERPDVDWCGCSPMVYRMADKLKIDNQRDRLFGRKFDPRIDLQIIDIVDNSLKNPLEARSAPGVYLELLHQRGLRTVPNAEAKGFSHIGSAVLNALPQVCHDLEVFSVHALYTQPNPLHTSEVQGFVVVLNKLSTTHHVESEVRSYVLADASTVVSGGLQGQVLVGTGWDVKERIVRGRFMDSGSPVYAIITLDKPIDVENPCAEYHGDIHENGLTCCQSGCGEHCGATNCHLGVGGSEGCCHGMILKKNFTCSATQKAPCLMSNRFQGEESFYQATWNGPNGIVIAGDSLMIKPYQQRFDVTFQKDKENARFPGDNELSPGTWELTVSFSRTHPLEKNNKVVVGALSRQFVVFPKANVAQDERVTLVDVDTGFKVSKLCSPSASCGVVEGCGEHYTNWVDVV